METVTTRFARWIVVFGLMLAYWPFGNSAIAAIEKPQLDPGFQKALYTAQFDWRGETYRFEVSSRDPKALRSGQSRFVAQISELSPLFTNGPVVATCERHMSANLNGKPSADNRSLLMRCQGRMFGTSPGYVRFEFKTSETPPLLTVWPGRKDAGLRVALRTERRTAHLGAGDGVGLRANGGAGMRADDAGSGGAGVSMGGTGTRADGSASFGNSASDTATATN